MPHPVEPEAGLIVHRGETDPHLPSRAQRLIREWAHFHRERRQIAASVSQNWRTGEIAASASSTGVLVFRMAPQSDVQFTWVDRIGRKVGTVGAPDSYTNFDVSPDGRRRA